MLSQTEHTDIVRLVVKAGMQLLQYGAESKLAEQTTVRLGVALGLESVEVSLTANAILVTGLYKGRCITSNRRVYDRGINMHVLCEVQRLCIRAEQQELDCLQISKRLDAIVPHKYNRWLVVLMVGLSCASFSHLFGGDLVVYALTFFAAALAMVTRQEMAHRHHNPIINFCLTAFVATLIATIAVRWQLGNEPQLVMAASVLLLVPGFPLINAVSDMLKGHVIVGLARWVMASLLSLGAATGIALAMYVTGIQGWM